MTPKDSVRCKVQSFAADYWSESRDWMSETEALDLAAGARASGKYTKIKIRYSRKFNGRWRNCDTKDYPPQENKFGTFRDKAGILHACHYVGPVPREDFSRNFITDGLIYIDYCLDDGTPIKNAIIHITDFNESN